MPHANLADLSEQLTKQRPFWCLPSVLMCTNIFCWICLAEKRFYTHGGYLKKRRLFCDIPPKVCLWHKKGTSVHVKKPSCIGSKYNCATPHTHICTMSHIAGLERLCHRGIFFWSNEISKSRTLICTYTREKVLGTLQKETLPIYSVNFATFIMYGKSLLCKLLVATRIESSSRRVI